MLKICLDHFRVGACNVRRESRFRCRKQTCRCEKQIKHRTWNTAVGLFLALWVICMGMIRIHQLYLVYYSCCAPGACAFVLFCFQLIHWTAHEPAIGVIRYLLESTSRSWQCMNLQLVGVIRYLLESTSRSWQWSAGVQWYSEKMMMLITMIWWLQIHRSCNQW